MVVKLSFEAALQCYLYYRFPYTDSNFSIFTIDSIIEYPYYFTSDPNVARYSEALIGYPIIIAAYPN